MQITRALATGTALLMLAACGSETSTGVDATEQQRRVESPASDTAGDIVAASVSEKDVKKQSVEQEKVAVVIKEPANETAEEPTITVKAPTPMPEPENPIIAFKSEDGSLSLARDALTMVSPVHDSQNDVWSVFIQLDKQAAEDFYTLTSETTGEALAVVVEDMTVSTPILETAVYGGGFVFEVDDSTVASDVVATLQGEEPTPTVVAIEAEDAIAGDDSTAETTETATTEEEETPEEDT